MQKIAIYCSSRFDPQQKYLDAFNSLSDYLIEQKIDVIYGGANVGYMKVIADKIAPSSSQLIGVMPHFLVAKELVYPYCDEFIYVDSMTQRIEKIMSMADGFLIMPGGVGTYEEMMDMMSWVQLGIHNKPIGVVNVDGYYDGLLQQLNRGIEDELIASSLKTQVFFHEDHEKVLEWMAQYNQEEMWDVYDEYGNPTALIHPRGVELMANQYHKVVMIAIVNDQKEVLIQKRAPHVAHPNLWDISAGGSVLAGETSINGAIREVKEELGLDCQLTQQHEFFQMKHRQMLVDVYLLYQNIDSFDFSISNEVTEVKWVTLDTINQMMDDKTFKYGFVQQEIIRRLYEEFSTRDC